MMTEIPTSKSNEKLRLEFRKELIRRLDEKGVIRSVKRELEKTTQDSFYENEALNQRAMHLNERIATFKKRLAQKKKGSWKYDQLKRKIKTRTEELKFLEMLTTDHKNSDPFIFDFLFR